MNSRFIWKWFMSLGLLALPFAGGCVQEARSSSAPVAVVTNETATPQPAAVSPSEPMTSADAETDLLEDIPEVDISEADYKPISIPKVVPPQVRTNSPVGEIIRMAEAGVEEEILLTFVTNSVSLFGLDADEIIYLSDIGVPSTVVTAMLQHDLQLKATGNATLAGANAYQNALPPPDESPSPEQIAPQSTAPAPAATEAAEAPAPPQNQVTHQTFYDTLSPYGNWVYIQGYGNVWQPTVVVANPTWTPYVNSGRWLYTDAGWYWASDYSWGWVPFHYGRWFRHYRLGWCWYPDTVWGPSWVTWRYTDGYCGWAPLPPGAWYRPGIGLTWWGRHVSVGFGFGLGYSSFSFISWNHFHRPHLHHHRVHHEYARKFFPHTHIATRIEGNRHFAANRGLPAERVAAATGRELRPVSIRDSGNLAGRGLRNERLVNNGRELAVYRPALRETDNPGSNLSRAERSPGIRTAPSTGEAASRSLAASRLSAGREDAGITRASRAWERPTPATAPNTVARRPARQMPERTGDTAPALRDSAAAPDVVANANRSPLVSRPQTLRGATPQLGTSEDRTSRVSPMAPAANNPAQAAAPSATDQARNSTWQRSGSLQNRYSSPESSPGTRAGTIYSARSPRAESAPSAISAQPAQRAQLAPSADPAQPAQRAQPAPPAIPAQRPQPAPSANPAQPGVSPQNRWQRGQSLNTTPGTPVPRQPTAAAPAYRQPAAQAPQTPPAALNRFNAARPSYTPVPRQYSAPNYQNPSATRAPVQPRAYSAPQGAFNPSQRSFDAPSPAMRAPSAAPAPRQYSSPAPATRFSSPAPSAPAPRYSAPSSGGGDRSAGFARRSLRD